MSHVWTMCAKTEELRRTTTTVTKTGVTALLMGIILYLSWKCRVHLILGKFRIRTAPSMRASNMNIRIPHSVMFAVPTIMAHATRT